MSQSSRASAPPLHALEVLWSLRRMIHSFDVHSRKLADTTNVTLTQLLCLLTLTAAGPLTARDISRKIHVGSSTLVGVLDRLEGKKLIRRKRDPGDRRRILVGPTRAGRELIDAAPSPLGSGFEERWNDLPGSDRRRLAEALRRIADLVQPAVETGGPAAGSSRKAAAEKVKS